MQCLVGPCATGNLNRTQYACITQLRHPLERMVSAWFYKGHHPGRDYVTPVSSRSCPSYRGCSKLSLSEDGWEWRWEERTDNVLRQHSRAFNEYVSAEGYANAMTRMLGLGVHAYDATKHVNARAAYLAQQRLRQMAHIGLTELPVASMALLAHTFTDSASTCVSLWARLLSTSRIQLRRRVPQAEKLTLRSRLQAQGGAAILRQFNSMNNADIELYELGVELFCERWMRALAAAPSSTCLPALSAQAQHRCDDAEAGTADDGAAKGLRRDEARGLLLASAFCERRQCGLTASNASLKDTAELVRCGKRG